MYPGGQVLVGIALRTAVIYAVVLLGMRLSGKREVGQMTPFDLTLLLLLSNAVQNAMTGYVSPGRNCCRLHTPGAELFGCGALRRESSLP